MTETNNALGLRQATLSLREYQPIWAEAFKIEASLISEALAGVSFDIEHIGSTAVPGLLAKPILDIAVRSAEETQIAATLVGLGYIDRGMRSGRLLIRFRDGDLRTHNLHLYQPDDPDFMDQIAFRNALRSDPQLCAEYAALKQTLVERLGDKGRGQFADCKANFVKSALQQTR